MLSSFTKQLSGETISPYRLAARLQSPWNADPTRAYVVVLALVLGAMTVPPLLSLLQASFRLTTATGELGAFTLDHYRKILTDRQFFQSLWNSIVFCVGTAALAIGLGGVTAWLAVRTTTPLRSIAYLSAIVSLGTPYILYVTAWLFVLGRSGPLDRKSVV